MLNAQLENLLLAAALLYIAVGCYGVVSKKRFALKSHKSVAPTQTDDGIKVGRSLEISHFILLTGVGLLGVFLVVHRINDLQTYCLDEYTAQLRAHIGDNTLTDAIQAALEAAYHQCVIQ